MILASLDDIAARVTDEHLQKAFRFLRTLTPAVADGEVPIDGKNIFARIMSATTQPRDERFYETHREYIDVQYVFSGRQIIEWLPRSALAASPYDADADVIKYTEHPAGTGILMGAPVVAVFYPEDAHRPLCMFERPAAIRVCVVKVKCAI